MTDPSAAAPVRFATERTVIDPLGAADATDFAAYRSIPEVARYQGWEAPYAVSSAERLIASQPAGLPGEDDWLQLAVRDRASGVLLGDVAVHRDTQPDTWEVGVTLAPAAQGRGIATEALGAVVDGLFAAGAHRVWAQCDARNAAVRRVFGRLGMRREATLLDADWFKGEWTTVETFAQLASERVPS
jgi:RimJ/RimL family protein N-acetyltransferase